MDGGAVLAGRTECAAPQAPVRAQGGAGVVVTTGRCWRRSFRGHHRLHWRQLPPVFGASWQTVHRRFTFWSDARVWAKLDRVVLDRLGAAGQVD